MKPAQNPDRADITVRPRRLRRTPLMRSLVRETMVSPSDLVYPMFATHEATEPIPSMPGISRFCLDDLCREAERAVSVGIPAVLLFGIPRSKDEVGSEAYADDGIVPNAIRRLRAEFGDNLLLVADVCMCEYTSHGHCGIVRNGDVDNDATLDLLSKASVAYADAGADIIAPSDMMDGRVAAIRAALDETGHTGTPILSYAAKFASAFYGPFRDAADSTPQFGDRRSYQMDPPNRREALREVALDLDEGADMVMIKPALPYLDLVREVRDMCDVPVAAYNVSGEYSMLKAAVANGWLDESRAVSEALTCIKRAGADIIITYHAIEYAQKFQRG